MMYLNSRACLSALLLGGAVVSDAMAISFGGYSGPIEMKLVGFDEGTFYHSTTNGVIGGTGNVANDIATLNAQPQFAPRPNNPATGDTWGIFQIREITDATSTIALYNHATASTQLVGIFWGLQDIRLEVSNAGTSRERQNIGGVGMNMAVFEIPNGVYNPSLGANAAGAWAGNNPVYPTVTIGQPIWTAYSVPGFDADFLDIEFFTEFKPQAFGPGQGSISGGFVANFGPVPYWGVGTQNDMFETIPGGGDLELNFTGDGRRTSTFNNRWMIKVDDPIRTQLRAIPEPATVGLGLISLTALAAGITRRKV